MKPLSKSDKLQDVLYDIRGPVLQEAKRLEEEGRKIIKLNIGNPHAFGFDAPDEILQDVIRNIRQAQGYTDSMGIYSARKAIMQECQVIGIPNVDVEDIYLGNGVSELIVMTMQALLNDGDEMLVPSPDYPLWTGATSLAGGNAVHYVCDEQNDWQPDMADVESKITSKTKGIVVINPNNPTGAVYSRDTLMQFVELARKHDLVLCADEIYSKIVYDDVQHIPLGSLSEDVLTLSFNGLSKSYRLAGFRSGWMVISGHRRAVVKDFIEGLTMLASMRLCANAPAQFAIQTALGGYQSINDLVLPGGRLRDQRDLALTRLNAIPGISCVVPKGAIYCFAKLDPTIYPIADDEAMALDLLRQHGLLIAQGTAFNWHAPDHFRLVFLPSRDELSLACDKLEQYFSSIAVSP